MPVSLTATRRLDWLRGQRDTEAAAVATITDRATEEDRDLTDAEQAACERHRSRVEQLDAEVDVEVATIERQNAFDEVAQRIEPALRSTPTDRAATDRSAPDNRDADRYRSPGEYLVDFLLWRSQNDHAAEQRLMAYRVAHQTTAENPGIIPTPILGPVWTTINARRPAIEAATNRPMPAGGTSFTRPHVTQHTDVGKQTAEKTEVANAQLLIAPITVNKATYGGFVNLSFQNRDWTDPSIMSILVDDLAAVYAQQTDADFCTTFTAAVTQTETVDSDDAAGWLAAIYGAAAQVFAADNALPTTLWASTDVWGRIGALVDGSGRPLFPYANPYNAMGSSSPTSFTSNVAGLTMVVDANLASGTAIVGDARAVEFYEQLGGTVSAIEPSVLGTQIAYYGYAATAVIEPDAFVKLTPPVAGP